MKKHILEISGVRKQYNSVSLLSDVYLKVETGNIIGLFGRNGSGKSTLFKIIFGIEAALEKSIFIDGICKNNSSVLNQISYLHQNQFIPNHLSVKQSILLSIDKQKVNRFCDDKFVESILKTRIRHLSYGELRYLEVKLVLFNSSPFVILDEPFSGLSPKMSEIVKQLIQENSEEKGIILTDHNYENVLEISTDLLLLKEGKLHKIKDKAELLESNYLKNPASF